MGQASPDSVLEIWGAGRDHLRIRLGVQFRIPRPRQEQLPARYVRLQVASPPPLRVDGTLWTEGLVVNGGEPFDPDNAAANLHVLPVGGIAPLAQPHPRTIVLDRWIGVPEAPDKAQPPILSLGPAGPPGGPLSFQSIPYPDPRVEGETLAEVAVDYCLDKSPVIFDREINIAVDGVWAAVSLSRFYPPERESPDSIVRVVPEV